MFKKKLLVFVLLTIFIVGIGFKKVDQHFEISKNLEIFASVYKEVNTHYVDELKPGELMRTGVNAMMKSLDPYTVFYSEAQAEDALMRHQGEYGGLGISVINIKDHVVISHIKKDFPAAKNDLRVGDRLLKVNGVSVLKVKIKDISSHLKGGVGTEVRLEIERPGVGSILKTLKREKIKVKNVPYFGMITDNVGYIKLDQFMAEASAEVALAFQELKKNPKFNSLVFDLRDNGGGYLHEAVNIVNLFVPQNELVVTTRGRRGEMFHQYKTRIAALDVSIPLVVLINQRSASASEIVSGGLQDLDRAVIVGVNSFGKGLVQNTKPTKYRTQVKITTAKYYTPSGRCIQLKDYSNRNSDGSAGQIADSLRVRFKTRNGRVVKDGGGVLPDVIVEKPEQTAFVKQLIKDKVLFNYCNEYRNSHEKIEGAKNFKLSAEAFADFVVFANKSDFVYKSETSNKLLELKKVNEKEGSTEEMKAMIQNLEDLLLKQNKQLYGKNKEAIIEELELRISKRYYYDDALFEASYNDDKDIQESLRLLADSNRRQKILSGE